MSEIRGKLYTQNRCNAACAQYTLYVYKIRYKHNFTLHRKPEHHNRIANIRAHTHRWETALQILIYSSFLHHFIYECVTLDVPFSCGVYRRIGPTSSLLFMYK